VVSRRTALFLAAIITTLAVVAGPASPARAACSCAATTPQQGMADAGLVFVGSLASVSAPVDGQVTLHFDVRLVYKGEVAATVDVATFASAEDCGLGDSPRRGDWLVFAYTFAGTTGLPLLSTCSPSVPLVAGEDLPLQLGEGRAPPGAVQEAAPVVTTPIILTGTVPDPAETLRTLGGVVALFVVVGVVARLLAGRRRLVVR
jgi:hypothetical protein